MASVMIFGGSGRSGQAMVETALRRGHSVLAPTHGDCDLADAESVSKAVLSARTDVVINCAAISGLEACADDALTAHRVNAVAPAAMALACRHTGGRFVHLSTDYVLGGHKAGLKDETARCKPGCLYAASKWEGEQQIMEVGAESLILRVSWLCGNPARPGFAESVAAKAVAELPLAAVADKYSLPTDVYELAEAALQLAENRQSGLLHVCATGAPTSWHQYAEFVVQALVDEGALPQVAGVSAQRLKEVPFFREERPQHTAMNNARLRALGIPMSSVEDTVRKAVRRWLARRG